MTATKKSLKKPAKKKATPKKSAAKKRAVKRKTATKKSPAKKTVKKTTKRNPRTASGKKHKKTTVSTQTNDTVTIPSATRPRWREKAALLQQLIDDLERPMYRIAYVTAFSFFAIGIFSLLTLPPTQSVQSATTICHTTDCDELNNSSTPEETVTETNLLPEFDIHNSLPTVLEASTQVSFTVSFADNIEAFLTGPEGVTRLRVEQLSTENFKLTLKPETLLPGKYSLTLKAVAKNQSVQERTLGLFTVPEPPESAVSNEPKINNSESSTQTDNSESLSSEEVQQNDTDETVFEAKRLETATDTIKRIDLTTTSTNQETPVKNSKEETNQLPTTDFNIDVQPEISGQALVTAVVPTVHQTVSVELLVRPIRKLEAQQLGRMSQVGGEFRYVLNSINLPNGEYELFAIANTEKQQIYSNSRIISVVNSSGFDKPVLDEVLSNTDSNETPEASAEEERSFVSTNFETEIATNTTTNIEAINPAIQERVSTLLDERSADVNDLLRRYSVARQSNDSSMLRAIESEIKAKRQQIVTDTLADNRNSVYISQIDAELNNRFTELKKRADTFEEIRKSRLDDSEVKDTDKDGISDFDEVNLFNTNPEVADTDQDGFTDGAEIIRGFNPTDATPEAVVRYELPTELTGLARPDVLQVTEVRPVVKTFENQTNEYVDAEIVGVGLPNSFVTLYIFSDPIIVTVKTDADGSFVYRFDKELPDGEHKVFVAFTDNTGSVLAHSEPFRFVKEAQAFTPVDVAAQSVDITPATIVETSTASTIRFVLGTSILVLGFFLLMLGISLRREEPQMINPT